jgi:aminoglycoside phosphotransferase (APT) family kinase protein
MLRRLPTLTGEARRTVITNFMAAAFDVGAPSLHGRPYGHVLADDPIHSDSWTDFLAASLDGAIDANREVISGEIGDIADLRSRALALLADVPQRPAKALVHGDYFPGNVLLDDALSVSGVVDFSAYTLVGDPLYDALTAPIFLEMIEETTDADLALAADVVRRVHSDAWGRARFYRAHAAFWMADPAYALPPYPRLYPWAIDNLRRLAAGAY